jgi:hypothetical protein
MPANDLHLSASPLCALLKQDSIIPLCTNNEVLPTTMGRPSLYNTRETSARGLRDARSVARVQEMRNGYEILSGVHDSKTPLKET